MNPDNKEIEIKKLDLGKTLEFFISNPNSDMRVLPSLLLQYLISPYLAPDLELIIETCKKELKKEELKARALFLTGENQAEIQACQEDIKKKVDLIQCLVTHNLVYWKNALQSFFPDHNRSKNSHDRTSSYESFSGKLRDLFTQINQRSNTGFSTTNVMNLLEDSPLIFRRSHRIMKEMVSVDGWALELASDELKEEPEILHAAFVNTRSAYHYMPMARKRDFEIAGKVYSRSGYLYLDSDLEATNICSIAEALAMNRTLRELSIQNEKFDENTAQAFARALKENTSLQTLELYSNKLTNTNVFVIADMLRFNTSLHKLEIQSKQVNHIGGGAIAHMLNSNNSLSILNMSYCRIGNDGATSFAAMLIVNAALQELHLSNNNVKNPAAIKIAKSLNLNVSLRVLSLSYNNIGNKGINAFAVSLQINTTLQELFLLANRINNDCLLKLFDALKVNSSLRIISFTIESFDATIKDALVELLKTNTSLRSLYFHYKEITNQHLPAIVSALQLNYQISRVSIRKLPAHIKNHLSRNKVRNDLIDSLESLAMTSRLCCQMSSFFSINCNDELFMPGSLRHRRHQHKVTRIVRNISLGTMLQDIFDSEYASDKPGISELVSKLQHELALEKTRCETGENSKPKQAAYSDYKLHIDALCESALTPLFDMALGVISATDVYPDYKEKVQNNPIAYYLTLKLTPNNKELRFDLRKTILKKFAQALEYLGKRAETEKPPSIEVSEQLYNEDEYFRYYEKYILKLKPKKKFKEEQYSEGEDEKQSESESPTDETHNKEYWNIPASLISELIQLDVPNTVNKFVKDADADLKKVAIAKKITVTELLKQQLVNRRAIFWHNASASSVHGIAQLETDPSAKETLRQHLPKSM